MLRISIRNTAEEKKFILEGKLTKDWCPVLLEAWQNARNDLGNGTFIVDLRNIALIDECGMAILAAMSRASVKFIASGVLTIYLLKKMKYMSTD